MRYVPPFGESAGAPYVNANPATGQRGSVPPAEAIEHAMREIVHCIVQSGQTPSGNDLTQLWKAIEHAVQQALGSEAPAGYVTTTQLEGLPIYPEILTADWRIPLSSPSAGQVLIASGVDFKFNGVFTFSTSSNSEPERLFVTLPSKIYHLRRRRGLSTFQLLDLADPAYNPSALPETHPAFDSAYDDILAARVVTNAANVPEITTLINRDRLFDAVQSIGSNSNRVSDAGGGLNLPVPAMVLNWSRTPKFTGQIAMSQITPLNGFNEEAWPVFSGSLSDGSGSLTASVTRYGASVFGRIDTNTGGTSFNTGQVFTGMAIG